MFFVVPFLLTFVTFVSKFIVVSAETISLVACSIAAFYFGCFFARVIRLSLKGLYSKKSECDSKYHYARPFAFASFFMILGAAFMGMEFVSVGGAPVFLDNMETARFKLQINGYVHLLAINTGLVGVLLLYLKFLKAGKVDYSLDKYAITGGACLLLMILTGNRLDIFIPIVILTGLCIIHGWVRISTKSVLYVCSMILILGLIKHYREMSYGGAAYVSMVADQIDYKANEFLLMLYPLYMTFAYNFVVLDKLVSLGDIDYTGGIYTVYPLYSLLPGSQLSFGEYSNFLLGVKYYSVLTSTYLSNLYVDFGFSGAVAGSSLLGFIFTVLYLNSGRGVVGALVYAVVLPRLMLSFYVFPFEQFSSIFSVFFVIFFGLLLKGGVWRRVL